MANTYLGVSTSSSGTRTKWTTSFWVKRSNLSSDNVIFGSYLDGSNQDTIRFTSDNKLQWYSYQASSFSNGGNLLTNRLFRDTNAWYHIVCRWDTNNSTADDRMKIWVNGVEETSFNSRTNPSSGRESLISYQGYTTIGRLDSDYLDGCLSHIHFCDNQSYQASDFGETDTTTGEWKIKTSPSVSYGNRGYFVLKDGNSLTDQSGLGNNLTLQGGTLTNTEDCPSNVFATANPLDNQNQSSTFTNGNTTVEWHFNNKNNFSTLAMNAGKFYWEMKYVTGGGGDNVALGISKLDSRQADGYAGHDSTAWSYYASNGNKYHNGSGTSYGNSWTANDIIGVAFDADTRTIWFSKNGVWQNSATISEIAAGTTTNAAYTGMGTAGEFFIPCISAFDQNKITFNFGNGYFGTTAVSSAGTNASGNGIFEYDVPTGYTALSTKGLNL